MIATEAVTNGDPKKIMQNINSNLSSPWLTKNWTMEGWITIGHYRESNMMCHFGTHNSNARFSCSANNRT